MDRDARLQGLLVDNGHRVPRQAARTAYPRSGSTPEHEPRTGQPEPNPKTPDKVTMVSTRPTR
nr:MAG TPA: hypothetical protein [Bacteriophage sp.]